jgi:hypothetical protein
MAAISAIAPKLAYTKQTLGRWLSNAELHAGARFGPARSGLARPAPLKRASIASFSGPTISGGWQVFII